MTSTKIYEDIAKRSKGEICLGVVGPVRSGKSTLIQRFMETLVLPNLADENEAARARDEMPQSAGGKTVMTTEPKFVPKEAARVVLQGGVHCRIRLCDCVGFLIPGALGEEEDGQTRMVHTPWQSEPIPFAKAAYIGTEKVIKEHATVGILVTSDGSIGEFSREEYREAEQLTVSELKKTGKPFIIVCNSADTESEAAMQQAMQMEQDYGIPVALVNCQKLDAEDIRHILELLLFEFPVRAVAIKMPTWLGALPPADELGQKIRQEVYTCACAAHKLSELGDAFCKFRENAPIASVRVDEIDAASGKALMELQLRPGLFYETIAQKSSLPIENDADLMRTVCELAKTRAAYERLRVALDEVEEKGYGIVMPQPEDLKLEEPEIVKQSAGYGVKLRASAPSIHMIKAQIEAEVSPIVGTEQQSEEIVKYLLHEFEEDPAKLWETDLFGKSLHELINEGLHSKLSHMPDDARQKIADTIGRIINEGSGGLICILL